MNNASRGSWNDKKLIEKWLTNLKQAYCMGKSKNVNNGDMTSQEMIEIMFQAGMNAHVKSVDITDFDPSDL